MGKSSLRVRELTCMALLVALNCISAYLIIPLPFTESPLALQTLVVNIVGFLLRPKQAFIVMGVYILLGLAGAPVFTGGMSGFGKMFGPTGGYIWGFVLAATIISILKGNTYQWKRFALVSGDSCYLCVWSDTTASNDTYAMAPCFVHWCIAFYSVGYCKMFTCCRNSKAYFKRVNNIIYASYFVIMCNCEMNDGCDKKRDFLKGNLFFYT